MTYCSATTPALIQRRELRHDNKRRAHAAGQAVAKGLADGRYGDKQLLERVRDITTTAGAALDAREPNQRGLNTWQPVHDAAQRLATTLGNYRGAFDGVPLQRLGEEQRALTGALEDLARSCVEPAKSGGAPSS